MSKVFFNLFKSKPKVGNFKKMIKSYGDNIPATNLSLFDDFADKATTTLPKYNSKGRQIFATVNDSAPKRKPMKLRLMILKPLKERFYNAIDLFRRRNPRDFVSKTEAQDELGKLIYEKIKMEKAVGDPIHLTDLYNATSHEGRIYAQINRDIDTAKEMIKIMD